MMNAIREKNEWLKKNRKVEEIALLLAEGKLWKVADHPNQKKYQNQKRLMITYILYHMFWKKRSFFLKTAFPHRKGDQGLFTGKEKKIKKKRNSQMPRIVDC